MKKSGYKGEEFLNTTTKPLLLILSGPSGTGKDSVLTKMRELDLPLEFIVTVTTRPQRAKEKDNIDYHFISRACFQEMLQAKELLEWANVYGNWYGVPKKPVKQALDSGKDVVVKVDIQGVITIKKILDQAVSIFLIPPSIQELTSRLKQRNTESKTDLDLRLQTAEQEIKKLPIFDYAVVNKQEQIDSAVSDIIAIITAEKLRTMPRKYNL